LPAALVLGDGSSNPAQDLIRLAESDGCEIGFDAAGTLVKRPFPDPASDQPVWRFALGESNLGVGTVSRELTDEYRNGVVVRGDAPWLLFPIVAEAWNTNPDSATYFDPAVPHLARADPRPHEMTDSIVGTVPQAQRIADAKLPDVLDQEEQVRWSAIPHPGLDVSDVVEIESPALEGGRARAVMETLTIPVEVGPTMDGTARVRRVV
jgi:hypothetical protein